MMMFTSDPNMIGKRISNQSGSKTKILSIIIITFISISILDVFSMKEIKAQPVFPGSQQLTKIPTPGNQLLPQQKSSSSICDPNDTFVNTTESKICGVPPTVKPNNTGTEPVPPGPSSILSSSQ
jgi:hypothetical protein